MGGPIEAVCFVNDSSIFNTVIAICYFLGPFVFLVYVCFCVMHVALYMFDINLFKALCLNPHKLNVELHTLKTHCCTPVRVAVD